MTTVTQNKAKPGLWIGLFFANVAIAMALNFTGAINAVAFWVLFALNFVLIAPAIRAGKQWQEEKGAMSNALRRYNRRFLAFSACYMVVMLGTSFLYAEARPSDALLWVLAILPVVPIMGMIWTLFRYLKEETDEFLRDRAVNAALVGLGFVLVLGSVWGFLETYGLVPHVWAWWVFPAWAIGLGIGMMLNRLPGDTE
ncbi:MAG: hypothetical protein WBA68_00375 [Alteraurantiacibacter sp.]